MTEKEIIVMLEMDFYEEIKKAVNKDSFVNYAKYGFTSFIDDCMQESAMTTYEKLSIDDLYVLAKQDIDEKISKGHCDSLNEVCIEVCFECLQNIIDLAEVVSTLIVNVNTDHEILLCNLITEWKEVE